MLPRNVAFYLQLTVVKPTSALFAGVAIDNDSLTCEGQNWSAGLNSGHVNVQLTSGREESNKTWQKY